MNGNRTRHLRRATALLAGLAIVGAACSDDGGRGATPRLDRSRFDQASALQPFDRCDELLDHLRTEATARVTAYGLPGLGGGVIWAMEDTARSSAGSATPPSTTAANESLAVDDAAQAQDPDAAGGGQPGFSTTNTVEAGVDEPDSVKTDGKRLYALAGGKLRVVAIDGPTPVELGSLQLPGYGHELLLLGSTVVVLGQAEPDDAESGSDADRRLAALPRAALYQVDVADPTSPKLVRQLRVDGQVLTARMVGGVARVVVQSAPAGLPFLYPSSPGAEEQAVEFNRSIVARSTLEDWVPTFQLRDGEDGVLGAGPLVRCEAFNRPPAFHGFGTLSVLTLDLNKGLSPGDATAVLADGQRVYASKDNLYVAFGRYDDPAATAAAAVGGREIMPAPLGDPRTAIHVFSIAGAEPATYTASGEVPGELLNEFSMSEHRGDLRVALTTGAAFGAGSDTSESQVTVLRRDGNALRAVGEVGGLGKGERIHGVRFVGDVGYVVTFRQTDPLYLVDLSVPEAPKVTGELKILGYSAYLHPLGDGRLLGVGQDATEEGRRTGAQVSLFDVSDPANPTRLSQYVLPNGWAQPEGDYKSFLWWAPERLALLPVHTYEPTGEGFAGMVGLDVTDAAIDERGRIGHPTSGQPCAFPVEKGPAVGPAVAPDAPVPTPPAADDAATSIAPDCFAPLMPVNRAVVVGDVAYTLSEAGVLASNLSDLAERGWLPFS
jgi:uncharacterized secreted protein with C-terminal beta-propeller domain